MTWLAAPLAYNWRKCVSSRVPRVPAAVPTAPPLSSLKCHKLTTNDVVNPHINEKVYDGESDRIIPKSACGWGRAEGASLESRASPGKEENKEDC